jgi:transposase
MAVKAMTLVGLDVHARQTHAAVIDPATGEGRVSRLRMAPVEVVGFLEGLGPGAVAVYEAGPTGFGLARAARERGIDVRVVAPGSIPKGAGDRVKTDRRDAIRLVRLLAAGELSFAFVPTVADERFRDLVRAIEDVRGDLMRARHRLGKFLLRRGEHYPGPGRAWTAAHRAWPGRLRFEDACSQATLADYLAAVELLNARRRSLLVALEQHIPGCSHAPIIARLRCFRGIDTLTAAGLCAEVGSFARFPRPALLSGFLGIVPSERTSDTKRRQGSITKAGPGHARRLPTEAAHHYRHAPTTGATLAERQNGQDPRIIAIAWRAQRRLLQRWTHLHRQRRKPAGVVAIACARELAAFLWEAATLDRQRPPPPRPGRCRGAHEHHEGQLPSREARDDYYGQPAPAGRARS